MHEHDQLLQWERDLQDCKSLLHEVFLQMENFYTNKGKPDYILETQVELLTIVSDFDRAEIRLHTNAIEVKSQYDLRKMLGE